MERIPYGYHRSELFPAIDDAPVEPGDRFVAVLEKDTVRMVLYFNNLPKNMKSIEAHIRAFQGCLRGSFSR